MSISASGCSSKKRKTLDHFFIPSPLKKVCQAEPTLSSITTSSVPGLSVIEDLISEEEERSLLAFLDAQAWRTDLARRVIHYGGTYCLMPPRTATPEEKREIEKTILKAKDMPPELEPVVKKMIDQGLYTNDTRPEYCIVNEYRESQGISAHVENFRFASPVCGLTLGNGDWMRFHELVNADDGSVRSGKAAHAKRTGRRCDVWMPPRSLLAMSGEAREKWQHEIPRTKRGRSMPHWRRVSLTFRTDKGGRKVLP